MQPMWIDMRRKHINIHPASHSSSSSSSHPDYLESTLKCNNERGNKLIIPISSLFMQAGSTVFVIIRLFRRRPLGIAVCSCAHPTQSWPLSGKTSGLARWDAEILLFFFFFTPVCLYSFEIFFFFYLGVRIPCYRELCFLEVVPVFRHFSSPPCVYLSVWTCSPGGIVGVGVLSGLIAAWCLVGRRAWLGRRWGKTSCPRSLLSLSHPFFCLSSFFFFFFLPSRWLSTWLHRMMAVLHGSLTGRERDGQTQKDRRRESGGM